MIGSLKPYPNMKDSGFDWLGRIPAHWQVRRFKYLLREHDDRSKDGSEQLLRVSQYTGVTERKSMDGSEEPDTRASSLAGYKTVNPNQLVVNIMLAWNGSMGVSAYHGICSPAYCVYRFNENVHPWYYHNLLRSPVYKARIKALSTGVVESRLRLYTDDLYGLEGLLPPIEEQEAIVRYLDYVDRRVRRLVRAKKKLIALLEEQKQAIIHRAVTRGLDPNVPLKDSGVEWLGQVPVHWEVRRLKFLVAAAGRGIQMGPFGASLTDLQTTDTGFKLFGQENTISGDFHRGSRWLTEYQYRTLRRYELVAGDLVLTRKGSLGNCKVIPFEAPKGIADSDTIRVRLDLSITSPLYIALLLQDAPYVQRQIESVRRGAVLGGLNTSTIADLRIATPPLREQQALLARLEEATQVTSIAIARVQREVGLLSECRTRLIADVVTGKLDVRQAAASLPAVTPLVEDNSDRSGDLGETTDLDEVEAFPEEAGA